MSTLSKKQLNSILFGVSVAITILFIGLTLGLALRPYSTIMPYQCKVNDVMVKGYLEDNNVRIEIKGQETQIIPYNYEDLESDKVNAFEILHVHADVDGSPMDMGLRNIGNFVCVFLFAFIAVIGIGASIYTGITLFKKK